MNKRRLSRRWFLAGGATLALTGGATYWWRSRNKKPPLGMDIPEDYLQRGRVLLDNYPAIDVHSHPGRFFLTGAPIDSLIVKMMRDGFEAERIADMDRAGVTGSLFAIVSDLVLLGFEGEGLRAVREYETGEAYNDYLRQLTRLQELVDNDVMALALSPQDILDAHRSKKPVAILATEGADFVEQRLERLAEAYDVGIRAIGLVHYHINQLGDIQTESPRHGGLTALGGQVVDEMNRLGLIIDLAHATFDTSKDVIERSSAPVLLSHSNLMTGTLKPARFLSGEHAQLVAQGGGIIGAWPAGIGSVSLADFVDQVLRLIDHVGVEHVGIGTDMDANYKPVLTEYADYPVLAAALLYRGLSETETVSVLGENFLRVFTEVGQQRQIS